MTFRQKQIRMKNATNGFIISSVPYREQIFHNLEDAIKYIRKFYTEEDKNPYSQGRDYGKSD